MVSAIEQTGQNQPTGVPKLKVFISYSRSDLAFADELAAGLDFQGGFEVLIDRESIHEGEAWKARLGNLIAGADTIVFVVSPASADSQICAWEVKEAERLSKRIIPVQATPLDGAKPPPQLAALNYVRFDPHEDGRSRSFIEDLVRLCHTLDTDIDWLREHTRLLTRAREWDSADRTDNRCLFLCEISTENRLKEDQEQKLRLWAMRLSLVTTRRDLATDVLAQRACPCRLALPRARRPKFEHKPKLSNF